MITLSRYKYLLLSFTLLILVGYIIYTYTEGKRKANLEPIKTKTDCVGRLIVEIPDEFEIIAYTASIRGIRIERLETGDQNKLDSMVAKKIQALKNGEVVARSTPQIFRSVEVINGVSIITSWDDLSILGIEPSEQPWRIEAFVLTGDFIFKLEGAGTAARIHEVNKNFNLVLTNFHPRGSGEIPSEQGICLKDAFLGLPIGDERQGVMFSLPNDPVGIEVGLTVRPPNGREIDLSAAQSSLGDSIEIAGLKGRAEKLYHRGYNFYATVGQQTTSMASGYEIDASYFDNREDFGSAPYTSEYGEQIWQTVLNSIRIRK